MLTGPSVLARIHALEVVAIDRTEMHAFMQHRLLDPTLYVKCVVLHQEHLHRATLIDPTCQDVYACSFEAVLA